MWEIMGALPLPFVIVSRSGNKTWRSHDVAAENTYKWFSWSFSCIFAFLSREGVKKEFPIPRSNIIRGNLVKGTTMDTLDGATA